MDEAEVKDLLDVAHALDVPSARPVVGGRGIHGVTLQRTPLLGIREGSLARPSRLARSRVPCSARLALCRFPRLAGRRTRGALSGQRGQDLVLQEITAFLS